MAMTTSLLDKENKNSNEFWDGCHSITTAWKDIFRLEKCNTDTGFCKVCDVGCGSGQFIWALRNLGVEAWGFDSNGLVTENRYEKCQEGWAIKHDATVGWPYGDKAFDLVVAVDLFEYIYLEDINKVIDEMYRVAKKWIFLRITTCTSGHSQESDNVRHVLKKEENIPIKPEGVAMMERVTLQDRQFWINKLLNGREGWRLRDDTVQRFIELVPKNIISNWTSNTIIILERLKRKDYDKNTLEVTFNNIIGKKNVLDKDVLNREKRELGRDLTNLLIENKNIYFAVAEPGGNSGDILIYKGLYKKLRDLNIKYEDVRYGRGNIRFGKAGFILIQGGSNVNDLYNQGTLLLKNIISSCELPIIVAPQTYYFTFTNFPEIFKNSKQKIYLFCREEESYSVLKKMQLPDNVSIHVSDDTAFYMEKEDFSSFGQHDIGKDYALLCLRKDKESNFGDSEGIGSKIIDTLREIVRNHNIDIIERDISTDIHSWTSFDYFARYIKGAKIVITDRLHVGILASILEKPTILFSNSYFKSKAIYEYSLRYFPYTIFLE